MFVRIYGNAISLCGHGNAEEAAGTIGLSIEAVTEDGRRVFALLRDEQQMRTLASLLLRHADKLKEKGSSSSGS